MLIKIELDTNFDEFPYIDTFTYGGEGFITNDQTNREAPRRYEDTAGDYKFDVWTINGRRDEEDSCYWSEYHGAWLHQDEAVNVQGVYYLDSSVERVRIVITPDGVIHRRDDCNLTEGYILPGGELVSKY